MARFEELSAELKMQHELAKDQKERIEKELAEKKATRAEFDRVRKMKNILRKNCCA